MAVQTEEVSAPRVGGKRGRPKRTIWARGVYAVVRHAMSHFAMTPRQACRYLVMYGLPFRADVADKVKAELLRRWDKLLYRGSVTAGDRRDPERGREQVLLMQYERERDLRPIGRIEIEPGVFCEVCWIDVSVDALIEKEDLELVILNLLQRELDAGPATHKEIERSAQEKGIPVSFVREVLRRHPGIERPRLEKGSRKTSENTPKWHRAEYTATEWDISGKDITMSDREREKRSRLTSQIIREEKEAAENFLKLLDN
jgi:hypothetical protein